ncbi:MAG TPA: hypothetical protein PLR78_16800, partial [Polaromonas sp.]|uniref:hypothetical protein n=1 Tax=Polaromonas sp. TaxID=1869339 RepID=UPI002C72BAFD
LTKKPLPGAAFFMGERLKEARIYSSRPVITWLGRSTALVFLQIFPIFAAKTALQPIPTQAPRIHNE